MKLIFLIVMSLYSVAALGRYDVTVSEQFVEGENQREARKIAIEKAISDVSLKKIATLIGEKRFKENQKKITKKVLSQKNRFIPFFKVGKSSSDGKAFKFEIEVRLSQKDLIQVLRTQGLFASGQRSGIVLPFVDFIDHIHGESFRWWQPEENGKLNLQRVSLSFERELSKGFLKKGLLALKPQTFGMVTGMPNFLRKGFLTQTEKVQLALLHKGQLFIEGKLDITKSPLRASGKRVRLQLSCHQAGNGKNIAEVVRSVDTPPGQKAADIERVVAGLALDSGGELAQQVFDQWQRGELNSQIFRLAVTGQMNHRQMMLFKNTLRDKIPGIQGLRESLFEPGRVTFEVNFSGGTIEELHTKIRDTPVDGFLSQVVATNAQEIILDVKPQ